MADHPFVGMRGQGESLEPFVIGAGRPVWELIEAVSAAGSVDEAATVLGVSPTLVRAAVDYYDEHGAGAVAVGPFAPRSVRDAAAPKSALERAGQVAALFTAVVAIVYVAGGVVLAMRLYFARVNADAVIGQLPRELLLTIGVGQVLLPVLVLTGVYAGYRLLKGDGATLPATKRWRQPQGAPSLSKDRLRFIFVGVLIGAAIVAPGGLVAIVSREELDRQFWWLLAAFVIATAVALVAVEVRARIAERALKRALGPVDSEKKKSWSSSPAIWEMTALWAALLVPAAIIFWPAFVQLQEAKVCTTSGFEEIGDLIGQTSNGVYLAENRFRPKRRVATFTTDQIEEVFIGTEAGTARCDPSGLRGAALASARATEARFALRQAKAAYRDMQARRNRSLADAAEAARDPHGQVTSVRTLVERVLAVARNARDVAVAADRTTPGVSQPIYAAASKAEVAANHAGDSAGLDRIGDIEPGYLLRSPQVTDDLGAAVGAASAAFHAAARGAKAVVEHVDKASP